MLFIIVLAEPSRLAAVGGWERACPRSHMCSAATDDGWDGQLSGLHVSTHVKNNKRQRHRNISIRYDSTYYNPLFSVDPTRSACRSMMP